MSKLDVFDLVGTPYKRGGVTAAALDCRALAWTAAARIPLVGLSSPEDAEQTTYDDVAAGRSGWRRIGDEVSAAKKVGHLVITDSGGVEAGVMLLVNEDERLFITTNSRRGHAFLVPARAVKGVLGVYEWEAPE